MKKIMALVLSLLMLMSMSSYAFGSEILKQDTSGNDEVYGQSVYKNPVTIKCKTMKIKKTKGLSASIKYPVLSNMENQAVQKKINAVFLKAAKEQLKLGRDAVAELKTAGINDVSCGTKISYTIKYNRNGILSVVSTVYQYAGGAHGTTTRQCFNFDFATGQQISLEDMMNDYDGAKALINKTIRANIDKKLSQGTIAELTPFKTIDANQDYYFASSGLRVVIQQDSDYFPYAAGMQVYTVPYEDLNKYMKNEYKFFAYESVEIIPSEVNRLKPGQLGYFVKESNPSTGFSWEIKIEDSSKAQIVKQQYVSDPSVTDLCGAGGKEVVVVRGLKEGKTNIIADYAQHWEGGSKGENILYNIDITEK